MKTAAHGGVFFDLGLWPTTGAGMGWASMERSLLATKAYFNRLIPAPIECQPSHPPQSQLFHAPNRGNRRYR